MTVGDTTTPEAAVYLRIVAVLTMTAAIVAVGLGVSAITNHSLELTLWSVGSAGIAGTGVAFRRGVVTSPLAVATAFVVAVAVVFPLADQGTGHSLVSAVGVNAVAGCLLAGGRWPKLFAAVSLTLWVSGTVWLITESGQHLTAVHAIGRSLELVTIVIGMVIAVSLTRNLSTARTRHRRMVEMAPVALWENDFSQVLRWMERLRARGVTSLSDHLRDHPNELARAATSIRMIDANPTALESLGLRTLADLDHRFTRVLSPETLDAFAVQFEAIWSGDLKGGGPITGSTLQGENFDALMRWSMVGEDGAAHPQRTITAVSDISGIRQAERARLEASERLRAVAESSPDAIVSADASGRIESWNPAAAEMFGYSADEICGQPITIIMPQRFESAHQASVLHAAEPGAPGVIDPSRLTGVRRDGSEFPVDLSVGSWISEGETHQSAVIRDMSVAAAYETDLRKTAADLEKAVAARDVLITAVSHELRTPLTAVMGIAEILRSDRKWYPASELDELIGIIADEANDMADILEDLLVASRMESTTIPLARTEMDLAEGVDQVAARLWLKQSPVARPIINGNAAALADPTRVRQIVRNLLTNAARHGGPSVHVDLHESGSDAVISVFDNGAEIPPALHRRLFEPYALSGTGSGKLHSIGVGLSVSRHLARLMGGDLRYSRIDGETNFKLTLPRAGVRDLAIRESVRAA
jgi:PAS domain S-box-containing protein